MQRETASSYELLIPQGEQTALIPITAQDDAEAIALAWTYVLDHPTITSATLKDNGRVVSYLSQ